MNLISDIKDIKIYFLKKVCHYGAHIPADFGGVAITYNSTLNPANCLS